MKLVTRRGLLQKAAMAPMAGTAGCADNNETIPSIIQIINVTKETHQFIIELSHNDEVLVKQEIESPPTHPEAREEPYRPYVTLHDSLIMGEEYHARAEVPGIDSASRNAIADCTDNRLGDIYGWTARLRGSEVLTVQSGCEDSEPNN